MTQNSVTPLPHMLHGCDYNPEQWLHMPEILDRKSTRLNSSH